MTPKITIIIPIYNVEKYLEKCIESVLNQSLEDIEVLCVDDCSPDNSYKIVEHYVKNDSRVRLIRLEKNIGLGGARNVAIRMAKAKYIASVDADDRMLPDMLEVLWKATDGEWFDVVCCGFNRVDMSGNILASYSYIENAIENVNNNVNIFNIMNPAFWNKLWRKSLFIDNHIFFPHHDFFEDMSTTPRLLTKARYIKIIKPCLYEYLVRPESITNTYGAKHIIDYFKGFGLLYSFLEKNQLLDRYKDDFIVFANSNFKYHSECVLNAGLSKPELEKYFRLMLFMKMSFFENYDLIKSYNLGELLGLFKQPLIVGAFQKKYLESKNNNVTTINDLTKSLEENRKLSSLVNSLENEKNNIKEKVDSLTLGIAKLNEVKAAVEKEAVKNRYLLDRASNENLSFQANIICLKKNISHLKLQILKYEEDKDKNLPLLRQKVGVCFLSFFVYPFISDKKYLKLKNNPKLYFKDSKNYFSLFVGKCLNIK